ncbi:hypothetical protein Tco_0228221 [Tanacetum coccineum]
MASSCCSSNMLKDVAFTKYIRDKIADVKASLTRVRTTIREMESKSDKDAWKDAIDCFKETKDRLELKCSFDNSTCRQIILMV